MVLRVAISFKSESLAAMLRLPSSLIARGTRIPPSALAGVRNARAMLDARSPHVTPPSAPRPVRRLRRGRRRRRSSRETSSASCAPAQALIDRGVGLDTALDSVDQQAVMRATTAYAARGGGLRRRSVAGFRPRSRRHRHDL